MGKIPHQPGGPAPLRYTGGAAFALIIFAAFAVPLIFSPRGEFVLTKELLARILIYAALLIILIGNGIARIGAYPRLRLIPDALVFLTCLLPSLAISFHPRDAIFSWLGFADAVILCMMVGFLVDSNRKKNIFILAIYCSLLIVSLYGILQGYGIFPMNYDLFRSRDPGSTFGLTNFAAEYIVVFLPVLFGWSVAGGEKTTWKRTVPLLAGILAIGLYLLLAQNRGAMVGLAVGGGMYLAVLIVVGMRFGGMRLPEFRAVIIVAGGTALIAGIFLGLTPSGNRVVEKAISSFNLNDPPIRFRFQTWKASARMIQAHPVFGVGLSDFRLDLPEYQTIDLDEMAEKTGTTVDNPHNEYLYFLAENGAVGFLGWLFFVVSVILLGFRELARARAPLEMIFTGGFLAGLLGFLANSFFCFNFHIPASRIAFFIVAGLLEANSRISRDTLPFAKVQPAGLLSPGGWKVFSGLRARIGIWVIVILTLLGSAAWVETSLRHLRGRIEFLQGGSAAGMNRVKESLAFFQNAVRLDPRSYIYYYNRSVSYDRLGMPDLAEQDLEKTLALYPNMTTALYDLAVLKMRRQEHADAVPLLERAIELNSSHVFNIRVLLAQAFLKLGEFTRALDIAEQLVEMRDDSYLSHFLLANAYHFTRNYPAAGKHYLRVIHLNPHYPDAYKNLGLVLIQEGRKAEAITILETAVSKWADHPELWYYLGCAFAESRRYPEAARAVRKAIDLDPKLREKARQEKSLTRLRIRW